MNITTAKHLLNFQILVLMGGTVFTWSKLIPQFSRFQDLYGTLFRFRDCAVPNPLATACFYGSVAFLVALVWSVSIALRPAYDRERRMRNFLVFCVLFAGSVVLYEVATYYHLFAPAEGLITCSPGLHPLRTPCFYGLLFFVVALITAVSASAIMRLERQPDTA